MFQPRCDLLRPLAADFEMISKPTEVPALFQEVLKLPIPRLTPLADEFQRLTNIGDWHDNDLVDRTITQGYSHVNHTGT